MSKSKYLSMCSEHSLLVGTTLEPFFEPNQTCRDFIYSIVRDEENNLSKVLICMSCQDDSLSSQTPTPDELNLIINEIPFA